MEDWPHGSANIPWMKPGPLVAVEHSATRAHRALSRFTNKPVSFTKKMLEKAGKSRRLNAALLVVGPTMVFGSVAGCAVQTQQGLLCHKEDGQVLDAIGRLGNDCSPMRAIAETGEVFGGMAGGVLTAYALMNRTDNNWKKHARAQNRSQRPFSR